MDRYWSWGGRYIGVRQNGYLVDCDGAVIGRFWGQELYNSDGEYMGEVMREKRLIRNLNKRTQRRTIFSRHVKGRVHQRQRDVAPYPEIAGYEDF